MSKIFILGSVNMDLVINSEKMPKAGETVMGSSFLMNPGGKGANQAVAVAQSGTHALMVGALGTSFSDDLKEALDKYQVDTTYLENVPNVSSGVAIIVLADGDNRIIVDPGSNYHINHSTVDEALKYAQPGDYLLCQLEIQINLIEYAFEKAKKIGMVTFLNVAPAKQLPKSLFPLVDYFCANQTETQFYSYVFPHDNETAFEAAKVLIDLGVKHVLITLGVQGSVFYNHEKQLYVPSYKVTAIDTTAAGDAYIGAFLSKIAQDFSVHDAMDYASCAAALCVTKKGAQQAIANDETVLKFQMENSWKKRQ